MSRSYMGPLVLFDFSPSCQDLEPLILWENKNSQMRAEDRKR